MPSAFRIGTVEIDKDRAAFSITENRLSPAWMNDLSWGDVRYKEPGVTVMRFSLVLTDGRLSERWDPFAIVSLHALAAAWNVARTAVTPPWSETLRFWSQPTRTAT